MGTIARPAVVDGQDRHAYIGWLRDALQRERCRLHAYVLMTNHVHLLLTPEQAVSVPRVIMSVGRRYVQYINHVYGRTGTPWDSRYKSSLVQPDTYLLVCQRYIELNPVRAGIVADPGDYSWSSYRANALGEASPLLSPHPLFLSLAADDSHRREAYRDLFRTALGEAPIAERSMALNQGQPIGNHRFYAQTEAMTGQRREIRKRGRPRKQDDSETSMQSTQQALRSNNPPAKPGAFVREPLEAAVRGR